MDPTGFYLVIFAQAATRAARRQLRRDVMGRPAQVDPVTGIITAPAENGIPIPGGWGEPVYDATGTKMVWVAWLDVSDISAVIRALRRALRVMAQNADAMRIRIDDTDWRTHNDIAWADRKVNGVVVD